MNKHIQRGLALVVLGGVGAANAAIDVTAATGEIADAKTAVLAIGVAVFAVAVGLKLYKWLKAAL
jgi:imidazoleglycerol phosphate synthase glutamine amidotransferase subunit HisH